MLSGLQEASTLVVCSVPSQQSISVGDMQVHHLNKRAMTMLFTAQVLQVSIKGASPNNTIQFGYVWSLSHDHEPVKVMNYFMLKAAEKNISQIPATNTGRAEPKSAVHRGYHEVMYCSSIASHIKKKENTFKNRPRRIQNWGTRRHPVPYFTAGG